MRGEPEPEPEPERGAEGAVGAAPPPGCPGPAGVPTRVLCPAGRAVGTGGGRGVAAPSATPAKISKKWSGFIGVLGRVLNL